MRPCGHQLPVYRYQSVCRLQCLVFSGAHWVRCASYDPGIVKSGLVLSVGGTLMGLSRVPRRADCGEVFRNCGLASHHAGFVQCSACPRSAEPHERMHVHACVSPPSLLSNHLFQRMWCTRQNVRLCPMFNTQAPWATGPLCANVSDFGIAEAIQAVVQRFLGATNTRGTRGPTL